MLPKKPDRSIERALSEAIQDQDTIKTSELPAIPSPEERSQQEAFRTIQFKAVTVDEAVKKILPVSETELGIRKACEEALQKVLESLLVVERTPAYANLETIPLYKKEFARLLIMLKDGELGTESLVFHLRQKCQILENIAREFACTRCAEDLKQALQICKESKIKLLQKLQG